jgi:LysM repeat protein
MFYVLDMYRGFFVNLLILGCLAGCGRIITPTPSGLAEVEPTPSATPVPLTETPQATATPRLTALQTPAIPTLTPTPILYTVQSGDTLLKIATDFEITMEAVQAANGIVDPRFLEIGQTLIIPPPRTGPVEPPTSTPTPLPLNVTAINFQQTRQGTLWLLGAVTNPGSQPLTGVVIEATLFDGAGILLARETGFTQLEVIQPGHSLPFALLFETPPSSFAQYQVTAIAGVPLPDQTRYYFDLETFDLRGVPEGPTIYRISGQLRNRGAIDAETIRLVAVAYDQEDRVLAQRNAELAVTLLKAGAATPFEIDLIIPQGAVDHYEIFAQALQVQ